MGGWMEGWQVNRLMKEDHTWVSDKGTMKQELFQVQFQLLQIQKKKIGLFFPKKGHYLKNPKFPSCYDILRFPHRRKTIQLQLIADGWHVTLALTCSILSDPHSNPTRWAPFPIFQVRDLVEPIQCYSDIRWQSHKIQLQSQLCSVLPKEPHCLRFWRHMGRSWPSSFYCFLISQA